MLTPLLGRLVVVAVLLVSRPGAHDFVRWPPRDGISQSAPGEAPAARRLAVDSAVQFRLEG